MDTTAATIELRPTANASQFTRNHVVADTTEAPVCYFQEKGAFHELT